MPRKVSLARSMVLIIITIIIMASITIIIVTIIVIMVVIVVVGDVDGVVGVVVGVGDVTDIIIVVIDGDVIIVVIDIIIIMVVIIIIMVNIIMAVVVEAVVNMAVMKAVLRSKVHLWRTWVLNNSRRSWRRVKRLWLNSIRRSRRLQPRERLWLRRSTNLHAKYESCHDNMRDMMMMFQVLAFSSG